MQGQLPRSGWGLSSQGVEQFGRSEALVSSLHHHLSFLNHVHEFDPDQGVLGCLERFDPQHGPCHPLYTSMILLNGLITNDKFCMSRMSPSRVHWARRPPLRQAHSLATTGYLHNDLAHCGGADETSVAHTSPVSRDGGWSPAMGSSLPAPASLQQTRRVHVTPSSSGGRL
jgi:hypothetical protein